MNLSRTIRRRWSYGVLSAIIVCGQFITCDTPTAQQLTEFKKQYEQLVAQQKEHNTALANTLLASKPSVFDQIGKKRIISDNEVYELQVADLVRVCGNPETSFGTKGLEWLLIPVADGSEIKRRQTIVRSLVEDSALFIQLQALLKDIEKSEAAVLMYWDKQDTLMLKFSQFYYSIFPESMNKSLNKNTLALNAGVLDSLVSHSFDFWQHAFLGALVSYTGEYMTASQFTNKTFSLSECVAHIFKEPIRDINPFAGAQYDSADGYNTIFRSAMSGTFGDRFWAAKDLIERRLGNPRPEKSDRFWDKNVSTSVGVAGGTLFAGVLGFKLLSMKYFFAKRAGQSIKTYFADLFLLRANLKKVATFIRSLEKFESAVNGSSALVNSKTNRYLAHVMNKNHWSADLKSLMAILDSDMFNQSQKFFLPGQIFAAHSLMQEVKGELVPAMQAVAEFDAYLSLAKMIKQTEGKQNRYSFVEFVEQDIPLIQMNGAWTPFVGVEHAVGNPVQLGNQGYPTRMVITGPNGGGKSIYFTALGQAVLMAHSWGIVPAAHARMTYFNQIRTSFAPKEDKLHGISKFMAQKRHIATIERLMNTSSADNKMLVLLDEPFDGTTEHLMAERVYDFGAKVKQLPYVVVGIATHVKKPIELALDGSFRNYHVGIEEPELGLFERTFKLVEGPAEWWFADQKRGARYQDWLDLYMQRRATSTMIQAA